MFNNHILAKNIPTEGEPRPHNHAEVLEVLRGPSNLRCMSQKSVTFCFLSFSFGVARNCGFGMILGAGFLEYLRRILA